MDKIPQQNKTNRVIFVQPGKIVSTSVINFFICSHQLKGSKHGFLFCFVLFFHRGKRKHSIVSSAASFCISSYGNLWLCVSAKPTKSGAHLVPTTFINSIKLLHSCLFVSSKICSCVIISRSRKSTALFTTYMYANICKGQKRKTSLQKLMYLQPFARFLNLTVCSVTTISVP